MPGVTQWITWVITTIASIFAGMKAFDETKKLIEEKIMPDIKTEDKAEEIVRKQELAKSLVAFTGIEVAYYTARGLIIALNFALIMHYALKFGASRPRNEA
jgi:hypothetical protein